MTKTILQLLQTVFLCTAILMVAANATPKRKNAPSCQKSESARYHGCFSTQVVNGRLELRGALYQKAPRQPIADLPPGPKTGSTRPQS